MNALVKHSFEQAKNRLKEFSEKTDAKLTIERVRTDGSFLGFTDHNVTGAEFNDRLETIQNYFISVNTTSNNIIKEFRAIYNTFDALDSEYMAGIIANIKAIEKTSNDVRTQQKILKQHNEKLADQQNKLDTHQEEIEQNVTNISKIVDILKIFKEKLERYSHLTDIDTIWNNCRTIQSEIKVLQEGITAVSKKAREDIVTANNENTALLDEVNREIIALQDEAKSFKGFFSDFSEKLDHTANSLDNQIPVIQETASFAERLKTIEHIEDVDPMWDDLDVCKKNIEKIDRNIQTHQNNLETLAETSVEHKASIGALAQNLADAEEYAADSRRLINVLENFRAEISALNHLKEIDEIWNRTEEHQVRIKRAEQENKLLADKLNELEQADTRMRESIDSNAREIRGLQEYKGNLCSIAHLNDIDSVWKDVEDHTSRLIDCERRDGEVAAAIQKNKEEAEENIAEAVQTTNAAIEALTKKVKHAYWIAGGAVGLAIIELILLL